jgi:hypothetical protein
VTRVISITFPLSWIFIVIFGYPVIRDIIDGSGRISGIGPFLIFALIWSVIGITTIRGAWRDRKLLAEGDFAFATITHQESSGGKRPQSKILYKFRDVAGQLIESEGTDHSWELYENMEVLVFYKPGDSTINVPVCGASCELKMD